MPYREELLFWEGPAASKVYEIDAGNADARLDDWYLPGGKNQQQMNYEELQVLKREGFVSERKKTNFADFDPAVGNIVPKDGPFFEVVPLDQAVPAAGGKP